MGSLDGICQKARRTNSPSKCPAALLSPAGDSDAPALRHWSCSCVRIHRVPTNLELQCHSNSVCWDLPFKGKKMHFQKKWFVSFPSPCIFTFAYDQGFVLNFSYNWRFLQPLLGLCFWDFVFNFSMYGKGKQKTAVKQKGGKGTKEVKLMHHVVT